MTPLSGNHEDGPAPTAAESAVLPVLWFLFKLLVVFVAAMWPWAPVEEAVSRGFARGCNAAVDRLRWENEAGLKNNQDLVMRGLFGSTGSAVFVSEYDKKPELRREFKKDIEYALINFDIGLHQDDQGRLRARARGRNKNILQDRTDSWMMAHVPIAGFLAMWLVTPMPWKRRSWTLLAGTLLTALFVIGRLALFMTASFNGNAPHCLYTLGPVESKLLGYTMQVVIAPPAAYLVPMGLWMSLCVRLDTVRRIIGRPK